MIEATMLCCFSLDRNSNKFYEVKLIDSDRVVCRYGRVGQNGLIKEYYGGKKKYDSLIKKKKSQSKNYKTVDLEVICTADGKIIGSTDSSSKTNISQIALSQIKCFDQESKDLIALLTRENIHNIVSSTAITYDDDFGVFKTPLGIITIKSLDRSYAILSEIESKLKEFTEEDVKRIIKNIIIYRNNPNSCERDYSHPKNKSLTYSEIMSELEWLEELDMLNAEYFVLVPTKIKDTTDRSLLLYCDENVKAQISICDMLYDSVQLADDLKEKQISKETKNIGSVFDVSVEKLQDKNEIKRINDYFNNSKVGMHEQSIVNSRIKNIYKIKLGSQQEPFEKAKKEMGNVQELFHGTRISNLLSILSKGLLLPKNSPATRYTSLFGQGIYFSNKSSKSAQYFDGRFYGSGQKRALNYMLLADVVMGKTYHPDYMQKVLPKGYDSFHAIPSKSGIKNDEMIVFKSEQVRLTYILEIDV